MEARWAVVKRNNRYVVCREDAVGYHESAVIYLTYHGARKHAEDCNSDKRPSS